MGTFRYKNAAGKIIPSVTTIIGSNLGWSKDGLLAWYAREFEAGRDPRNLRDNAALVGTTIHDMIEHHIFGQDNFEPPEDLSTTDLSKCVRGLQRYMEWEENNNVEYLESELKMISERKQTGGCCDAIAMVNGVCTLIDFKTSKKVNAEHIIQIGCYRDMVRELTSYPVAQCIIIKISRDADAVEPIHAYYLDNKMVDQGAGLFDILRSIHNIKSDFGKYTRLLEKE